MTDRLHEVFDRLRRAGRVQRASLNSAALPILFVGRLAAWPLAIAMAILLLTNLGDPVVARGFLSAALMLAVFEAAWWWLRPTWRQVARGACMLAMLCVIAAAAAYLMGDLGRLTGGLL